jgi:hypothetical protein
MQVATESRRHREKTRQDDQDSQDEKALLSAAAKHNDISAGKGSPPLIRRGSAGGSQRGVVETPRGRTTPAMAFGHSIPSSTEEGTISWLL